MSNKCCEPKNEGQTDSSSYIICSTCKNKITDLKLLRCPRCFASLVKLGCDGNCTRCGK